MTIDAAVVAIAGLVPEQVASARTSNALPHVPECDTLYKPFLSLPYDDGFLT